MSEKDNKKEETFPIKNEEPKTTDKKDQEKDADQNVLSEKEILEQQIKELKEQLADVINGYKQLQKDFDNFRSRTKEESLNSKNEGIFSSAEVLFPALDAFKKAKKIITDKSSISGINLIEKSILANLEKLNIKKIKCKGKKFDPNFHNAIMLVEEENIESGTIVEEVELGFMFNEKVIKYSKVIVAK